MELDDFLREWHNATPYIVAHTSGSTGLPKEIHLMKADMVESARMTVDFFNINSSSHLHLPLSLDYIAGKMMVVRSLISKSRFTYEVPSSHPLGDVSLRCDRLSLVAIVPMQIDGLMASPHLARIENVIVGGAPLSVSQEEILKNAPFRSFATYGMTETASHVALRDVKAGDRFVGLPGYRFSKDDRGCLVIAHPRMSWRRVVTNDVVELFDDHTFRWLSRYDNVINSGAIKLYPEQIERAIAHLLPPDSYFVSSVPDERLGSKLVLVVDSRLDINITLEQLSELLPKYQVPKEIIRKEMVFTNTGKLKRLF